MVSKFSIFFNYNSSRNKVYVFTFMTFISNLFCLIEHWLFIDFLKCILKFIFLKNFRKFRCKQNSMLLILKLNMWRMSLKIEYFFVNFIFKCFRFFWFYLSFFEHVIYIMVFVNKKIILGTTMLNSFRYFWKHIFNMTMHVWFCFI